MYFLFLAVERPCHEKGALATTTATIRKMSPENKYLRRCHPLVAIFLSGCRLQLNPAVCTADGELNIGSSYGQDYF